MVTETSCTVTVNRDFKRQSRILRFSTRRKNQGTQFFPCSKRQRIAETRWWHRRGWESSVQWYLFNWHRCAPCHLRGDIRAPVSRRDKIRTNEETITSLVKIYRNYRINYQNTEKMAGAANFKRNTAEYAIIRTITYFTECKCSGPFTIKRILLIQIYSMNN